MTAVDFIFFPLVAGPTSTFPFVPENICGLRQRVTSLRLAYLSAPRRKASIIYPVGRIRTVLIPNASTFGYEMYPSFTRRFS